MSQIHQILNHMKTIGPITPLEAFTKYRCMRLGARIYDLKKLGYDISDKPVTYRDATGEEKRYKRYWLKGVTP